MAKCLVLGANGFIGSHLVDELVRAGNAVRAFDRFGPELETKFMPSDQVEIIPGDFLNRADIARAVDGMDYVFHFISTTTPATSENDPLVDVDTNIKMSIVLFKECVEKKVKKVIFPSTGGAVYGDVDGGEPLAETVTPQPVSPYAIGKLTIEHYLRYFKKKFDLDSVIFRISNPYGPRQALTSRQGVIPIFLQHIAKNESITVLGDGTMVRDYLYVEDVAKLVAASFKEASLPLYNLGSDKGVSVNELVEIIRSATGQEVEIDHQPKPATFVQKVVLDTSRFENEFGARPEVSLEDGIKKTWAYVQQQLGKA